MVLWIYNFWFFQIYFLLLWNFIRAFDCGVDLFRQRCIMNYIIKLLFSLLDIKIAFSGLKKYVSMVIFIELKHRFRKAYTYLSVAFDEVVNFKYLAHFSYSLHINVSRYSCFCAAMNTYIWLLKKRRCNRS